MNDLHWFPYQAIRPAGWALVHAAWQGAAIALLYRGLVAALRDRQPRVRYAIGCGCLALTAVAPVVTATVAHRPPVAADTALQAAVQDSTGAGPETAGAGTERAAVDDAAEVAAVAATIDLWSPRLLAIWMAGAALAVARLAASWRQAVRLAARGGPVCEEVAARLDPLRRQLALERPVELRRCDALDSPALLGWWRPVILLPSAALTLPTSRLDPLLAHELAHVRRHDYAVNVAQALVECLLFFQPAVRWLSRQVRFERELSCDDLAAGCCEGGALAYARGLAGLETLRLGAPALGVSDGNLLARIRRLVDPAARPRNRPAAAAALLLGCLLLTGSATALLPAAHATTVLGGLDPVHLIEGHERRGAPRHTAEHAGYRYLFADPESRARFLADPERYAVINVAICPASGRAVRAEIYRVIDGRIVLFCCPEVGGSDLHRARSRLLPSPTLPY